jgi:DNA-binding NarL/FixJ family response regulator
VTYVMKLRRDHEREAQFGLKFSGEPTERVLGASERIVNLASQGCTERQIAFQVGVSKTAVRRALGRAA